jgi:hypothetical protein
MNNFKLHYCLKNEECYNCFDKLNILLAKCIESSNNSKHCNEVYKPELCWPFDDCSICINRLMKSASFCNNQTSNISKIICYLYEIKNCENECKKK